MKSYFFSTKSLSRSLKGRVGVSIRRAGLLTAVIVLLTLAAPMDVRAQARQPVVPILNWVEYEWQADRVTASLGYYNPNAVTVHIHVAPGKNFISPGLPGRGQPEDFLPGAHDNVFQVTFYAFLEPEIQWTLDGQNLIIRSGASGGFLDCYLAKRREGELSLSDYRGQWDPETVYQCDDVVSYKGTYWFLGPLKTAGIIKLGNQWLAHVADKGALPGPPGPVGPGGPAGPEGLGGPQGPAGLNWKGAWSSSAQYSSRDAVSYDGSAWVALRDSINIAPVAGEDWSLLAQKGAAGPQGPAGNTNTFPSAQTYTIPSTGKLTVTDANVTANSVIFLQYIGGGAVPPVLLNTTPGQLTVSGGAGKQFRYVVFN